MHVHQVLLQTMQNSNIWLVFKFRNQMTSVNDPEHSGHPSRSSGDEWHKSKNSFMKTDASLFMTCFMRLESHLDHIIAFWQWSEHAPNYCRIMPSLLTCKQKQNRQDHKKTFTKSHSSFEGHNRWHGFMGVTLK